MMKTCGILVLLVSIVASFNQRSSILRQLQDLLDVDEDKFHSARHESRDYSDEIDSNRRNFRDHEQYMELRATAGSIEANTGSVISLQNRAAMNTRLRVLYTDANGNPSIVETGRLIVGQTKSVTLPVGAQHVKIIVEKDVFFENWHVAYNGTLTTGDQCLRIVGVTFFSKINSCK